MHAIQPSRRRVGPGEGLCFSANKFTSRIHPEHVLWQDNPVIRDGLTVRELHRQLLEAGQRASEDFRTECDNLPSTLTGEERAAAMDELRREFKLGPHEERVERSGSEVMRGVLSARDWRAAFNPRVIRP